MEGSSEMGKDDAPRSSGFCNSCCEEADFISPQRRPEGSLHSKELSAAEWIKWWCECFSLSPFKDHECLSEVVRPAWRKWISGSVTNSKLSQLDNCCTKNCSCFCILKHCQVPVWASSVRKTTAWGFNSASVPSGHTGRQTAFSKDFI